MTLKQRIREWLGINDLIVAHYRLQTKVGAHLQHTSDLAASATMDAARAQAWASIVAQSKGIIQFADIQCPTCKRNHSNLAIRNRQCSIVCPCGAHVEIAESGEVTLR